VKTEKDSTEKNFFTHSLVRKGKFQYLCTKIVFQMSVYKRKRGRPKKRGPKKKKPKVVHKYVGLKRPYHIITTSNGVQLKDVYSAVNIDIALKKLRQLQQEYNKDVVFPVRFVSNRQEKTFTEADYKLMLIKKREPGDTYEGKVRNEYGKYIDCVTDNEDWIFIDELPYKVEETFWVYGYNPKRERKTFTFIVEELVRSRTDDKHFMKQIAVFRNKVLISSIDKLEMVICKNHMDSVRMYNEIGEWTKKKKIKYVAFSGDINTRMYSFKNWYDRMVNLTHWTYRKLNKNTTRD